MGSPREYREHLYRLRTHPEEAYDDLGLSDRRDSFLTVYLSMIPFIALEYVAERSVSGMPSALLFPVGYLLFWAFYYTYYKPGLLEERLSETSNWNFGGVLVVLVGVAIWFVKVTVVELSQLVLLRWLVGPRPRVPIARDHDSFRRVPARPAVDPSGGYREFTGSWNVAGAEAAPASAPRYRATPPPRTPPGGTYVGPKPPPLGVPPDIKAALLILGLPEKVEWEQVRRRYRELAKKYHPDLNRDRTEAGRHFMRVDAAFRRLSAVRGKYFPEKTRIRVNG